MKTNIQSKREFHIEEIKKRAKLRENVWKQLDDPNCFFGRVKPKSK